MATKAGGDAAGGKTEGVGSRRGQREERRRLDEGAVLGGDTVGLLGNRGPIGLAVDALQRLDAGDDVLAKIRHVRLPADQWLITHAGKKIASLPFLHGKELTAVVSGDGDVEDDPRLHGRRKARAGEMLGAAELTGLGQDTIAAAHLRVEGTTQRRLAFLTHPPRATLDHLALDLRHAHGGRAGPRRERKDVEMGEPAFIAESERAAA